MTDDLDLREVHGAHEPDPAFRLELRRRIEVIVRASAVPTTSTAPVESTEPNEEDLIVFTDTRTPPGDAPRGRRRWLLPAAAVVAIALAVGVVVMANDEDNNAIMAGPTPTSIAPSAPPQPIEEVGSGSLAPGTYSIDPDGDPSTPLRVIYEVAADGWESWVGAAMVKDYGHNLVSILTVTNVVREGCGDQSPVEPAIGPTVDDLAAALSNLAPFEVTSPPTDVDAFGYEGKHMVLTVPDLAGVGKGGDRVFRYCSGGVLKSWISPLLGTFYGYNGEPGRTEEFWILDVDGTRLVIVTNTSADASSEDVAEIDAIVRSIRIQP